MKAIDEAFDWLVHQEKGQLVLAVLFEDLGLLEVAKTDDAVARRNYATQLLARCGRNSTTRVLEGLLGKERTDGRTAGA